MGKRTQNVLQFQSLGTLRATSGWLFPGVVGLAPEMGLAAIGLAGVVRLPCKGLPCCAPSCWGVRSPSPLRLDVVTLQFRSRHALKSPWQWAQALLSWPRGL